MSSLHHSSVYVLCEADYVNDGHMSNKNTRNVKLLHTPSDMINSSNKRVQNYVHIGVQKKKCTKY